MFLSIIFLLILGCDGLGELEDLALSHASLTTTFLCLFCGHASILMLNFLAPPCDMALLLLAFFFASCSSLISSSDIVLYSLCSDLNEVGMTLFHNFSDAHADHCLLTAEQAARSLLPFTFSRIWRINSGGRLFGGGGGDTITFEALLAQMVLSIFLPLIFVGLNAFLNLFIIDLMIFSDSSVVVVDI